MNINFFAAARAAAGVSEFTLDPQAQGLGSEPELKKIIEYLGANFQEKTASGLTLEQILAQCSFLVDGLESSLECTVNNNSRIDVLPPFAGG